MAIDDQILVSTYNSIQTKVASVLGQGTGEFGYGVTLLSEPIQAYAQISATQWDALRLDLTKAYKHQTGQSPTVTDVYDGLPVRWAHAVEYETIADSLVLNKDLVYTGATTPPFTAQVEVGSTSSNTIGPGWGINAANQRFVTQRYIISWPNSELARFFFNSGGYLRLTYDFLYSTGFPNTKTVGWYNIVAAMKAENFTFDAAKYRTALTGSRTVFFPDIAGRTDGQYHDTTAVYSENYGYHQFRFLDARSLEVFVMFVDDDSGDQQFGGEFGVGSWGGSGTDPGTTVDEGVQAYITAGTEIRRSIDQVTVTLPLVNAPPFLINQGLVPNAAATFSMFANFYTRDEGQIVRITLATTNVANNTAIPFYITGAGISAADVGLASLTAATNYFIIQNGVGFIDLTIAADETTEGPESFTITTLSDPITSITVAINDTSQDPPPDYSFEPSPSP